MVASTRLMGSLKQMVGTMLSIVQTRLELLANEFEEERLHFEQTLLYRCIALFFFGLSLILLTVLIIVIFWDSQRLLVLACLTGVFFIAGLIAWNISRRLLQKKSRLFSASLAELSNDRDHLNS